MLKLAFNPLQLEVEISKAELTAASSTADATTREAAEHRVQRLRADLEVSKENLRLARGLKVDADKD